MTIIEKIAKLKRLEGIEIVDNLVDLLINAGVCSVKDLASRNPNYLIKKFKNISEITLDSINKLIDDANKLNEEDKKYSIAIERYFSLMNRSFEKVLDLFLFSKLPEDWKKADPYIPLPNEIPIDNSWFNINSKVLKEYKIIYKDMSLVRERNKLFTDWKNKKKEYIQKMKEAYFTNYENNLSIKTFKEFYGCDKNQENRKCYYCGITEKQINLLIKKKLITTKRLYSRGKHLEVDQRKPENGYTKENIVLCCYWCNNAKTDEFSEKEFKVIAKKIKKIWRKRLNKINRSKISD